MTERLTAADVAFLHLEGPTTPQHVGGVAVFDASHGFDYDRLVRLVEARISLAPRYRQRVRTVPGKLAHPVWVDDSAFDITYHVRRSALPRPGTDAALLELVGRIQSRRLDRDRPLWEMYLIEGLSGARVAIVTKTHPSMVDGQGAIDITEVLLDESPEPRRTVAALWEPAAEPSAGRLVSDALWTAARRPAVLGYPVRLALRDASCTSRRVAGAVTGVTCALSSAVARSAHAPRAAPLRATLGEHRRVAVARTRLADFRQVRDRRGGTVHDVVLAAVTGALRDWLQRRGETLVASDSVRALVKGSGHRAEAGSLGWTGISRVAGMLIDLPVGESEPLRRLQRVQTAMAEQAASGRLGVAGALVRLSGFAPRHLLGRRAAHGFARRTYSVAITNMPGPREALFAAGARMTEMFPVLPLNAGQPLSIALTSYAGGVYFGLNADRDAVPEVADVADGLGVALEELLAASAPRVHAQRIERPRSRRKSHA